MRNISRHATALAALVAAGAGLLASAAAAQTATSQVGLRGFVSSRCGAGGPGDVTGTNFTGTISLGELSTADAHLRPALLNSTSGSPAGTIAFQVGCTGTAATITLEASRFSTPNPALGDGEMGMRVSNDIDYTAQAAMALIGGGITTLNYTTAATLPAPSTLAITEGFSFIPGNFEIRVFGMMPEGGDQSVLVAGEYNATINVIITPN